MRRSLVMTLLVGAGLIANSGWTFESLVSAAEDPHAYFNALAGKPEAKYSYSLRDQAQLDEYSHGKPPSESVTYNPGADLYPYKQDAAKVTLPENKPSIPEQVRLPITLNSGTVLITWDAWWGPEYKTNLGGLFTHKAFQVASPVDNSERFLEIRSRYKDDLYQDIGVDVRPYAALGPGTSKGESDRIEPMLQTFEVKPRTWTRYWMEVRLQGGAPRLNGNWDAMSMWVADENRGPVKIFENIQIKSANVLTNFWIEFNSSQTRTGPALVAYVRNVVVLQNFLNPLSILARPGAAPAVTGPPLSAPKNLRILPPGF